MEQLYFDILTILAKGLDLSTSSIQDKLKISTEALTSALNLLEQKGYLFNNNITQLGENALEPYKVDNAIIMAAGNSTRFMPLSLEKPKGLIKVKGEVLIERQICQLKESGIDEIILVVGYLKEQFYYLKNKYNIIIIENTQYYERNNNSSLYAAKDYLKNSYICSSDNYFAENVFEPYVYQSYYSALYSEGKTDEYCMSVNDENLITSVTIGGSDSWYMLGHVYFNNDFSKKFLDILLRIYDKESTKPLLWEQIYMSHITKLNLYMRKYSNDTIFEFDSIDELRLFDIECDKHIESQILDNICDYFNCRYQDLTNFFPITKGFMNNSFKFDFDNTTYIYRHPGEDTKGIINRNNEKKSLEVAKELDLDTTLVYFGDSGYKISYFIPDVSDFDYSNDNQVTEAMKLFKILHNAKVKRDYDFDIWGAVTKYEKIIFETDPSVLNEYSDFAQTKKKILEIYGKVEDDGYEKILCHMDAYDSNFMVTDERIYLIDWEFAGNEDPACDLGTFICCSTYSLNKALEILKIYLEDEYDKHIKHYIGYIAVTSFHWFMWATYKEAIKDSVGDYMEIYYKHCITFIDYYNTL